MNETENEPQEETDTGLGEAMPKLELTPLEVAGQIIADLEAQLAEQKDHALRAVAEAENVRRRAAKEKIEASKYAIANMARDLLAVPDTLSRALDGIDEAARAAGGEGLKNLLDGIELTQRQLLGIFERHGIKPINPLGEKFDPNFHQAVFEVPGSGAPDGTVIQLLQAGYVIGERLLRPAMVGVAKGAAPDGEQKDHAIDTKV